MGRAPCCDKASVKKGPWSPEEDAKLKSYMEKYGTGGNWIALPQKIGLKRCGKSCRLRWLNYLRPNIKHGGFSEEEDNIICSLYISIGSRWSIIAAQLPGRTDNDIKNYWNTRLKKKLLGKQRKAQHARRGSGGGLKQDMKRGGGNDNIPNNIIASANCNNNFQQNPCWPELPVLGPIPYSNKEPRFDDHASIRKLLIKLGGKFADNNNQEQEQLLYNATNLQYSSGVSAISYSHHHQQLYDPNSVNVSTSASMEALKDTTSAHNIAQTQHTPFEAGIQMMRGEGSTSFPGGLQEIAYSDPQRLDDLEFLLADDTVNYRIETPCGDINACLSDMNSQVYPPVAFNCDGVQQRLLQDHAFHELRFAGSVL